MEEYLLKNGFIEVSPVGKSRVFIKNNIRFSITRGASKFDYFNAGLTGQETYTYTYQEIPENLTKIAAIIEELGKKL